MDSEKAREQNLEQANQGLVVQKLALNLSTVPVSLAKKEFSQVTINSCLKASKVKMYDKDNLLESSSLGYKTK